MSSISVFISLFFCAYLMGSVPFGKIIGGLKGIDIQSRGSGNIGFANAVRVLGWKAGSAVLIADVIKGFVPTLIAAQYVNSAQLMAIGAVAVLAHIFPVWLRFNGGKGVATGLGVWLVLQTTIAVLGLATYSVVFLFFRKSWVSSVAAAWSLVIWSVIFASQFMYLALFLALLGTWTHRDYLLALKTEKI